jgi:hypothetical protein
MMTKITLPIAMLAALIPTGTLHSEPPAERMVMTWVPPYAIEKCRGRLRENFDGVGPKDALTHLGLQFWVPTPAGGLEKTPKYSAISDATVIEFRDWAHEHGIHVMLCVYNNLGSWDWSLARAGFVEHREEFVRALVAETERLELDGVDIDLEGNGRFDDAKSAFVAFVRDLSDKLHERKKQLTVDSFAYQWNAPNDTWWGELFPLVDGITSMGYEEIGANGKDWRAYAAQRAAAGSNAAKLMLGVPGDKAEWLGNSVAEHLDWIVRDGSLGVAIWDAQFTEPYWQTSAPWQVLAKLKRGRE